MAVQTIKGKKVSIHGDGKIFVNGKSTNLKQWESSPTEYSNFAGRHQKELSGKAVDEVLVIRGFLPR